MNENFEYMMLSSLLISVNRLYDVMLAIYAAADPDKATELRSMHEQGKLLAPPPAIETE